MRLLSVSLVCGALLLGGCATNPVTGKKDLVLVSEQQELALGQQAHRQTLSQYRVLNDPPLQQYVDAVGQQLAANSHRPDLNFTFTLLDSTEINAFALPGGYIYITRGLLAYMNSEAELAAVLGHEIGHVTARHGVRQASSAQAASVGGGLLSLVFPQLGGLGMSQTLGLLSTAVLRGYGREHELEADRLGAEYLAATNYDPNAMFDMIRTLKNHELLEQKIAAAEGREARAYHGVFSTHPDNDTRLKEVIQHAQSLSSGGERKRERFLNQIDGMIFGNNPAEGVFVDDWFLHPDLDFAFQKPANWVGQNLPDQLIMAEPQGRAAMIVTLAPGDNNTTPAEFLKKIGVNELVKAEAIGTAEMPGITGLTQVTIGGQKTPARLSVRLHGRYGYIFTGVAKNNAAVGSYDNKFQQIARSFRRLNNKERNNIRPRTLAVQRLKGPVSWSALGRAAPLNKSFAADLLKVLNGADGTQAEAGSSIKIVQ